VFHQLIYPGTEIGFSSMYDKSANPGVVVRTLTHHAIRSAKLASTTLTILKTHLISVKPARTPAQPLFVFSWSATHIG
jgi:hypothetical protein